MSQGILLVKVLVQTHLCPLDVLSGRSLHPEHYERPRGMYGNPSYMLAVDSSWYRPLAFLSPHLPVYNGVSVITFYKLCAQPHFAEYDLCAGHTFLGRAPAPDVVSFVGSSVHQQPGWSTLTLV